MLIYKKINNIMRKVKTVMKDKTVGYGNNAYRVVTYDRILSIIRQHLIEEEVLIIPSQIDRGIYTESVTSKGGKKLRYDALYEVSFIAVEDGSSFSMRTEVSADTFGDDKSPSKAITVAVKNTILKAFSLESGEDEGEELQNKITEKQIMMLQSLVTSTNTNEEEFLTYYGANAYADFPSNYYAGAIDKLQKKAKK